MNAESTPSVWTSLEIVKLVVGLLTPIMIVAFGFWVTQLAERFKASIWANQKVIEKRIAIYDEVAPMLNDIFCYFYFVGNWKELSPVRVIEIKRILDKKVYVYTPLFSAEFLQLYEAFMMSCFEHYTGGGMDARLRTSLGRDNVRKTSLKGGWDDSWDKMFSPPENQSRSIETLAAYQVLMSKFSSELGIVSEKGSNLHKLPSEKSPKTYKEIQAGKLQPK